MDRAQIAAPLATLLVLALLAAPAAAQQGGAGNGEFHLRIDNTYESGAEHKLRIDAWFTGTEVGWNEFATFGAGAVQYPSHDVHCRAKRPANALDFTTEVACEDGSWTRKRFHWLPRERAWEVTHLPVGSRVILSARPGTSR